MKGSHDCQQRLETIVNRQQVSDGAPGSDGQYSFVHHSILLQQIQQSLKDPSLMAQLSQVLTRRVLHEIQAACYMKPPM